MLLMVLFRGNMINVKNGKNYLYKDKIYEVIEEYLSRVFVLLILVKFGVLIPNYQVHMRQNMRQCCMRT